MKIKWQWFLYPVTVLLYLIFFILVYLPVIIYTYFRVWRARNKFIQAVKDANEGKIPKYKERLKQRIAELEKLDQDIAAAAVLELGLKKLERKE